MEQALTGKILLESVAETKAPGHGAGTGAPAEIADRTEGRVPRAHVEKPEDAEIKVNIVHVGGEKAYERALLEFEQANPGSRVPGSLGG